MRKIIIISLLVVTSLRCFPQFYPFDSIPGHLKKNADAVVRTEQCLYTVTAPGKAVQKMKKAVTLLNEDATYYRYLDIPYDKYSKVNYIKGAVYDEKGELIQFLGMQNVFDLSAVTGGTFYSDDRIKRMYFPVNRYPFTIEYEYEISYTSLFGYPDWSFQDYGNISVEKSGIQYVLPSGMRLRFSQQNLKNNVDSVITGDKRIYTWQETNIPARSYLASNARFRFSTPVLYAAPEDFEYGGIRGSMRSWKELGTWVYEVNKGRDALPPDDMAVIKGIVEKYSGIKERIKAIYEYMQSRTRYVSIQIGIGGYQTADAISVSRNGFGDCKGLVNYTMALLKEAGIPSYFSLVKAGTSATDINTRFVDNQFNHVILCVPAARDTVWLECTSQELPFNYLGTFTCNRHVLLLTPEGGKIVKTPDFKSEQNILSRTGSVFMNITGKSAMRLSTFYGGYNFDAASGMFSLQSVQGMKRDLYSLLDYNDFSVESAEYSEEKSENPSCVFKFTTEINSLGTKQGDRIYFTPSIVKEEYLPGDTLALHIINSDITLDSIVYYLPEGYKIRSEPVNYSVKNEYGTYSYSLRNETGKVIFIRRVSFTRSIVPADKYIYFRKFWNDIAKTDRGIIVLDKTTNT